MIDHESALRYRVPNPDTLDTYHLLTTDYAAWTRERLDERPRGLSIAEHLFAAAHAGHAALARIDLDCVRWNSLYEALRRWQERHGWKETGNR